MSPGNRFLEHNLHNRTTTNQGFQNACLPTYLSPTAHRRRIYRYATPFQAHDEQNVTCRNHHRTDAKPATQATPPQKHETQSSAATQSQPPARPGQPNPTQPSGPLTQPITQPNPPETSSPPPLAWTAPSCCPAPRAFPATAAPTRRAALGWSGWRTTPGSPV